MTMTGKLRPVRACALPFSSAKQISSSAALPPMLAAGLLPVAARRVGPDDRPGTFGPVVEAARSDPASLLLAHLGRRA